VTDDPPLKGYVGSVFGVPVYTDPDGKEFVVTRTCPKCKGEFPDRLSDLVRCHSWECPVCDWPKTLAKFKEMMKRVNP
jgi:ssDNA-binding Zn-finger/Zn-ribbon topoisomerase 1